MQIPRHDYEHRPLAENKDVQAVQTKASKSIDSLSAAWEATRGIDLNELEQPTSP